MERKEKLVFQPPPKKRKSFIESQRDRQLSLKTASATRVILGVEAFARWREVKQLEGFKTDALVAEFLLDCYQKRYCESTSTPFTWGAGFPPVSTITSLSDRDDDFSVAGVGVSEESLQEDPVLEDVDASSGVEPENVEEINEEAFNSIENTTIDWDDEAWKPEMETASVSLSEEDETKEFDTDDSDLDDEDFITNLRVRTAGALKTQIALDELPEISMEDSVHDSADKPQDETTTESDTTPFPDTPGVLVDDDIIGHPASICYHDSLKQLTEYLVLPITMCTAKNPNTRQQCGATGPFEVNIKSRGTAAVVEWMCPSGHTVYKWYSQPTVKNRMLAGDFMLASNILLSGNNFSKISLLFRFMHLGMMSKPAFFRIQDAYCVDTIKDFWTEKREAVIAELQPKGPVVVLGDGRTDSPGFCAQYCTYTAMDNDSKKIIYLTNIDKRETQRNSVIMEKEGFVQTMDTLCQELNVTEVCTDAHAQISALFTTGKYKNRGIHHTLDVWHAAKNLGTKIQAAGKQKACAILLTWSRDITNHFWHACKTADDFDQFYAVWTGLLHHVCGEHQWALDSCHHGPLEDTRDKEWINPESVAHQRLRQIVMDDRWIKKVHKYLRFRSTAELESFHNHILMYASKRFCFSPPVYAARTMLAALDYNHHIHRPAKRTADGSIQYRKLYKKRSKRYSLYSLKVDKDYSYIPDLQRAILQRCLTATAHTGMQTHEA